MLGHFLLVNCRYTKVIKCNIIFLRITNDVKKWRQLVGLI